MKTDFRYIRFEESPSTEEKQTWSCQNIKHGDELGRIAWFGPWKQYIYEPIVRAVYSRGCLADIAAFLEQVNKEN